MKFVRARKQGEDIVIPIPAAISVKEGDEFLLRQLDNGAVLLVPRVPDYFAEVTEGEYPEPLEWEEIYRPQGREWTD